jgi:hypothetical protein
MRRFKPGRRSTRVLLLLLGSGVVAIGAAAPAYAAVAQDTPISIDQTLGDAGPLGPGAPWAMITTSGSFTANGPGVDNGNVAVGSGTATFTSPFTENGHIYVGAGVTYNSNITPTGGESSDPTLVSDAVSAAQSAQSTFNGLAATQTVGTLGNNSTINSTASNGFNVIDASAVSVTNGCITLNGAPGSVFIVNIPGDFNVSNGGVALTGGVVPGDVVFNIGGSLTITGGGACGERFSGFYLVGGSATVHDDTLTGELIADGITDTSGFTVVSVPIGAIGGVVFAVLAAIVLVWMQRRRRAQRLRQLPA